MNILIDASIFQFAQDPDIAWYWEALISRLSAAMPDARFFVLWRSSAPCPASGERNNVTFLTVPAADYEAYACESKRLSALSKELAIDLFVGSLYTAPVSSIPTILFVYDMQPELFPTKFRGDDPLLVAKRSAIAVARRYVVFSRSVAENLAAFYDIRAGRVSVNPWPMLSTHAGDVEKTWASHVQKLEMDMLLATGKPLTPEERSTACDADAALEVQVQYYHARDMAQLSVEMLASGNHANALHGFETVDSLFRVIDARFFDRSHPLNSPSACRIPYFHYVKALAFFMAGNFREAELEACAQLVENPSYTEAQALLDTIHLEKKQNSLEAASIGMISNKLDNNKANELPIHFFTIVLNGDPFIRHHIDEFAKLPFSWHWHIIEGVAELKHDTAWSVALGGRITDELHSNGLSNDGTSAYLDELACKNLGRVTLYRKPKGQFWDGKLEMVRAPLPNITEECLLWQVDVDEFWTAEQICTAREMFLRNPDKTAAFYWCWFFVGPDRIVVSRNCYSQNPAQEWLRTWRYQPDMLWATHEPPRLVQKLIGGNWQDVAVINPFSHTETEAYGLVFQHYAYALEKQVEFKERYYGYTHAVQYWRELQHATLPTFLRNYLPWVTDDTVVDTIQASGVVSLLGTLEPRTFSMPESKNRPLIIIDGIFFQIRNTGIARVWSQLLTEWSKTDFASSILVLDRAGTAPKIPGIRYRTIQALDIEKIEEDRQLLQLICNEEDAMLFCSTYYTVPLITPSVFMAYDMIPENTPFFNIDLPIWQMKHYAIRHASAYMSISRSTARDLVRFHPPADGKVTVAHCAVDRSRFFPSSSEEVESFKSCYGIRSPYLVFIGDRTGYKNAGLLFYTLGQMQPKGTLEVVCVGGSQELEQEFAAVSQGFNVHILPLNDAELRVAYSGAIALVYPSVYEGFGLPILEAMASGCPVITCQNSSIPEVAGAAALYVGEYNIQEMLEAIQHVQQPEIRDGLIRMGYRQVQRFSWERMAETVKHALLKATGDSCG